MQEARFYEKLESDEVKCVLCPWFCRLKPGQTGSCKVRENVEGRLVTHVYGKVSALGTDPIEKKPLYHFHPGKNIFSVGEVGCNLHCTFCQNHRISQCFATDFHGFHNITSEQITEEALKTWKNAGIAYTYNEPFTFYEFMLDTARLAHEKGLKNVVVSNGYVNAEPLRRALPYLDAFNIDLKAFDNEFYKKQTKGKLAPVLEALELIAKNGKHLEITNLVIPGLNDDESTFESMVKWIAAELGPGVPLHLSRYFPQHKLQSPPTPLETLRKLRDIASAYLHFVYLGNVSDGRSSSTFCPVCGTLLVERTRYHIHIVQPGFNGNCQKCGSPAHMVV